MGIREELGGHATLAVMSLLGLCLYSVTYALLYAATTSGSAPVVAVVEMWMVHTHLLSACGCCVAQALLVSMFGVPQPYIAQAQTAVFLGIACSVSVLAMDCLSTSSAGIQCTPYFGAAIAPRLAGTGAMVWSLVMYASSLGAQAWGPSLSLGISGDEGLTASTAMALVPWTILSTLTRVCGDAWRVQFCGGVAVETNANLTASTVTADCTFIDTSLGLSMAAAILCLSGTALGRCCVAEKLRTARRVMRLLAACVGTGAPLAVWALQPSDVRVPSPPASHYLLCAGLASTAMISAVFGASASSGGARRARAPTTTTTTHSAPSTAFHFSPPSRASTVLPSGLVQRRLTTTTATTSARPHQ